MTHQWPVCNAFQHSHAHQVPCRIELCKLPGEHNMQEALHFEEMIFIKLPLHAVQYDKYVSCQLNDNKIMQTRTQDNLNKELLVQVSLKILCITLTGRQVALCACQCIVNDEQKFTYRNRSSASSIPATKSLTRLIHYK